MDLDVLGGAVGTLRKNGYKILGDAAFRRTLRTFGITDLQINDPGRAKHTSATKRFRVRLVTAAGERLPSKVKFSRRSAAMAQNNDAKHTALEQVDTEIARRYNRLSFRSLHYTGEAAVVQKVLALAGRPATQARDVFDLDTLQRGGFARATQVQQSITPEKLEIARQNLDSLTFEDFSGQVLEYLDEDCRPEYESAEAWREMKAQVRRLLGGQ